LHRLAVVERNHPASDYLLAELYLTMSDSAVVVKTRKFKKNPLLARKQVCYVAYFAMLRNDTWMMIRTLTYFPFSSSIGFDR